MAVKRDEKGLNETINNAADEQMTTNGWGISERMWLLRKPGEAAVSLDLTCEIPFYYI